MRNLVIHEPGGHDKLRPEEHPDPSPARGEVLLDVQAAGVNYADCVVRMGLYESAKKYVGWPITPGFDVTAPRRRRAGRGRRGRRAGGGGGAGGGGAPGPTPAPEAVTADSPA